MERQGCHRVRVEPSGIEVVADHDQRLMDAAHACGFYWPTVCGGKGTCRTCFTTVTEGSEHFSPIGAWEAEGIAALGLSGSGSPTLRLACQARVRGPATVRKTGVCLID